MTQEAQRELTGLEMARSARAKLALMDSIAATKGSESTRALAGGMAELARTVLRLATEAEATRKAQAERMNDTCGRVGKLEHAVFGGDGSIGSFRGIEGTLDALCRELDKVNERLVNLAHRGRPEPEVADSTPVSPERAEERRVRRDLIEQCQEITRDCEEGGQEAKAAELEAWRAGLKEGDTVQCFPSDGAGGVTMRVVEILRVDAGYLHFQNEDGSGEVVHCTNAYPLNPHPPDLPQTVADFIAFEAEKSVMTFTTFRRGGFSCREWARRYAELVYRLGAEAAAKFCETGDAAMNLPSANIQLPPSLERAIAALFQDEDKPATQPTETPS